MNLKRWLESLERQLSCERSTLFFEDGTSIEIGGRGEQGSQPGEMP